LRQIAAIHGSPKKNRPLAAAVGREAQEECGCLRWAAELHRLEGIEALDLLAPVSGWFTEGFDTADLKEAKALLDQLA
jgi:predicted ATPase